jgi:hypothetical protein
MAQKKVKPAISKQHDSTYYTTRSDTTFGTIEYNVGGGKVIAKGMIRHWQVITWKVRVPIDTATMFNTMGYSDDLNTHTDAYILYNGNWKGLDFTRFIFKPYENKQNDNQ